MMTGKIPQVFNPTTGQRYTIPTPSSQNHPSISSALDNAILKMMAYEAGSRYQTVAQLKTELNAIYRTM
jgi:serine/threonine protein kinase